MIADATPTQTWGQLRDPDIQQGLQIYADSDLDLLRPGEIRDLPPDRLANIAQQCGNLLIELYGHNEDGTARYPLSTKDAETLTERIQDSTTHMFALMLRGEELRSMAAIVQQENPFGADITLAELGRAAESPENNVSSRALLKERVRWVFEQGGMGIDFLTSTTRTAEQWADDLPGGKGVQSVWWGSRRFGSEIPFVTTHANYDYRIGRPEPFTGFSIPTDPQRWTEAVANQTLYVDSPDSADMIRTLIEEGTAGVVRPNIVIAETNDSPEEALPITALQEPSANASGIYAVTRQNTVSSTDFSQIDTGLDSTISQKITIEADIAGGPEGAAALRQLTNRGWTLVGWQPSQLEYGAICPVVARLNPHMADEIVKPDYHPRYFDEAGMPGTRRVLNQSYNIMAEKAKLKT